MKIFLFLGSRRGYAVLKTLIAAKANIAGILCLIEDAHEQQCHLNVTALATENDIPIFYTCDVKPSSYAEVVNLINPDIAFVIGWRYLITKEAYEIPSKGTLVIHDSLLPTYRGFAPMNWAIINGEKQTGVTLFHIAEGVDCGPIIDQLSIPIDLADNAQTLDDKIIKLYETIITKNISAIQTGKITSTPQDETKATYTCKRTPEDGEINWHLSATQIYNLIRGLTKPFPGAYTVLRDKKIIIWEAQLPDKQDKYVGNIPGRVLGKRNGMIEVLTGNGVIKLSLLQIDDEEQLAADFFVSVKDTFGK